VSVTATTEEITSTPLLDKAAADVLDQILAYPSTSQAQVSSSIITIPVGMETGLHQHDAPMYAYVLEGELTVTYDGGTVKTYRAGEAIMEAVSTPHNGKNTGTVPVQVLVVNMGADGVTNTVKLP
jgi:quercetin dioxygenase-like cupin family protein